MYPINLKVCDAMCGAGKTQAAIHLMNENPDRKFLFITPFLDEVDRIRSSCPALKFAEPKALDKDGKFGNLISLLENKVNIASTHALFSRYDDYVASLIKQGGYTLILDEVTDVVDFLDVHSDDVRDLIESRHIAVGENGRVFWIDENYNGYFKKYKQQIQSGYVIMDNDKLLLWLFPIEVFEAFAEVIILTYMFDAQMQKYYFDLHGHTYEQIGTRRITGIDYEFCAVEDADPSPSLSGKIHIVDDAALNEIGDACNALSVSWHEREKFVLGHPSLDKLKKNLYNVFRNKFEAVSEDIIWTTYKDYVSVLKGKGYTNSFLSFNARARNDFANRHYLGYCVNVYLHPSLKNYFEAQGVRVDEERYALSEMIQWVWRSAIRRGEEIWLYVPSSRMRGLFCDWLEEMK